jgi:hypothetical protein
MVKDRVKKIVLNWLMGRPAFFMSSIHGQLDIFDHNFDKYALSIFDSESNGFANNFDKICT